MDTTQVILLMVLASVCMLAFILYTKQFKRLFAVVRNGVIGCLGIAGCNFLLTSTGVGQAFCAWLIGTSPETVTVGINFLTAFIVGVLGIPGFFLLYVTRFVIG